MAEIRTSSGDRRVRGFRTDSPHGNPSDSPRPVSGRTGNRDGMGRDRRGSGKKQYPIPEGTERTELAAKSWETVLEVQLRVQLFESAFNMWVTPLQLIGQHENRLVLAGPGPIRTWVLRRYAEVIGDAIRDLTDFDGAILCDLPAEPANRGWI